METVTFSNSIQGHRFTKQSITKKHVPMRDLEVVNVKHVAPLCPRAHASSLPRNPPPIIAIDFDFLVTLSRV